MSKLTLVSCYVAYVNYNICLLQLYLIPLKHSDHKMHWRLTFKVFPNLGHTIYAMVSYDSEYK